MATCGGCMNQRQTWALPGTHPPYACAKRAFHVPYPSSLACEYYSPKPVSGGYFIGNKTTKPVRKTPVTSNKTTAIIWGIIILFFIVSVVLSHFGIW